MAGTLKTNRQQLGDSATATQNFTITAEAADGTMKIARGNAGATTQDVLTVDASGKVSLTQGIPTNGIPGLTLTSSQTTPLPGVGTALSYTHGLGSAPASAELEIVCLTAELGYSVGDTTTPYTSPTAAVWSAFPIRKNATVVSSVVGSNAAWFAFNITTGAHGTLTAANWAWRFKVRVS